MKGVPLPFHMNETGLLMVVLSIAPLFSHLTFFWSVWMLPKKEDCVSQENIRTLMKPSEWLKLNCEILFWVCAVVWSVVWTWIDSNRQFARHCIDDFAYCILQCTNLTTCWIFGTMTSSLESLTARCLNDIMTSEHLDDIIKQHQQLCKIIFGTSNAFKLRYKSVPVSVPIPWGIWGKWFRKTCPVCTTANTMLSQRTSGLENQESK
jgi:hypothetical protein